MEFERLIGPLDKTSGDKVESYSQSLVFSKRPEQIAESEPKLVCPKYWGY